MRTRIVLAVVIACSLHIDNAHGADHDAPIAMGIPSEIAVRARYDVIETEAKNWSLSVLNVEMLPPTKSRYVFVPCVGEDGVDIVRIRYGTNSYLVTLTQTASLILIQLQPLPDQLSAPQHPLANRNLSKTLASKTTMGLTVEEAAPSVWANIKSGPDELPWIRGAKLRNDGKNGFEIVLLKWTGRAGKHSIGSDYLHNRGWFSEAGGHIILNEIQGRLPALDRSVVDKMVYVSDNEGVALTIAARWYGLLSETARPPLGLRCLSVGPMGAWNCIRYELEEEIVTVAFTGDVCDITVDPQILHDRKMVEKVWSIKEIQEMAQRLFVFGDTIEIEGGKAEGENPHHGSITTKSALMVPEMQSLKWSQTRGRVVFTIGAKKRAVQKP